MSGLARKHDGDLNQDGSAPLTLALLLNLNVGSTEIPDGVDIGSSSRDDADCDDKP